MLRFLRQVLLFTGLTVMLAIVAAACDDDDNGDGDGGMGGATVVAPTGTPETASDQFPVTLERSDGQTLTLDAPPQRIVVLSAGHVETLFAIGAGDQVIAVDENSNYPPEAAAVEPKLSGFEPSVEAITAQDPDFVIVSSDQDGIVGALDGLEIPVFFDDINSEITSIEGVFESILELGRATGHSAEAEQLVDELEARVDAVVERVAEIEQSPRTYHELDENFFTVAPGDFVGDLYEKLNAQNIVQPDEGPYPQLSQEAIIDRNPEVILLADAAFGQTPEVVASRPGWDGIEAVQNDRIYPVDPDIFSRPGPRIVDALEELAGLLYPELFPEEASERCLVCSAVPA